MNLKDRIINNAKKDESWLKEAKKRIENEDWLEYSFLIALRILRYLKTNNISQKILAERIGFSPQYLNKVLKGRENLTLETICKIQKEINVPLIQIPSFFGDMEFKYDSIHINIQESSYHSKVIKLESIYQRNKKEVVSSDYQEYPKVA